MLQVAAQSALPACTALKAPCSEAAPPQLTRPTHPRKLALLGLFFDSPLPLLFTAWLQWCP